MLNIKEVGSGTVSLSFSDQVFSYGKLLHYSTCKPEASSTPLCLFLFLLITAGNVLCKVAVIYGHERAATECISAHIKPLLKSKPKRTFLLWKREEVKKTLDSAVGI